MTDNEIIKALECCTSEMTGCTGCPRFPSLMGCSRQNMRDALDLINRQKAEIERVRVEKDNLIKTYKECQVEAIKEFAKRLKENKIDIDVSFGYGKEHYTEAVAVVEIDRLVKEFTEGKNNGK